jgi:hypothetical protein
MKGTKLIVLASVILLVGSAVASPAINAAVVNTRVFNDAPGSTVTTSNLYPSSIWVQDAGLYNAAGGFANRHNFRLSDDGGIGEAVFLNNDGFALSADVKLSGTATEEGGLNVSPWWSHEVDGTFMINGGSGEVAIFGGRLPFYSFTSNYGLHYAMGSTVRLGVAYSPEELNSGHPGIIRYSYTAGGTTYRSPWIAFDMGNPAEDPPYGLWGILNDARVGGYFQAQVSHDNPDNMGRIDWSNISYVPEPASLLLVALAAAFFRRGR